MEIRDVTSDLLIEIGTEELPPLALPILSAAFLKNIEIQLANQSIGFVSSEAFATPRRLAILVRGIKTHQPEQESIRRGPALKAALQENGEPTPAALGFARSCGIDFTQLDREVTEQGAWLCLRSRHPGQETAALIPTLIESALAGLPIPKRMRWGESEAEFVRPVHWICLLLGSQVISAKILGVTTGRATRGHRFHNPDFITLDNARDYADTLRTQGWVEANFTRRRTWIKSQVKALAEIHGLKAIIEPSLLDEVTALTEWPQAILGCFDQQFLEIPAEILRETMQRHQRFFPVEDENNQLVARFIAVANLQTRSPAQVRAGYERVLRPRFADAAFFWEQDRKQSLEQYAQQLDQVVFQERLGTLAQKSKRLVRLMRQFALMFDADVELFARAAQLAKCDLVTALVHEFPDLQGKIGYHYAKFSGEDPAVCVALKEQYLPRFAGDQLPTEICGKALALADRLDNLVGIFGIGLNPTGTKDPYGLRRAALAILRILIETPLSLDLRVLLQIAFDGYQSNLLMPETIEQALKYLVERLQGYYSERAVAADTIEAVLQSGVTNPWDLDQRARAIEQFRNLPASISLIAANKRIRNILIKNDLTKIIKKSIDFNLLREPAELQLFDSINKIRIDLAEKLKINDYLGILIKLSSLEPEINDFFIKILVMDPELAIRHNRLVLLQELATLFSQVADLTKLQVGTTIPSK